ncbi:SCO family protein [Pseudomonas sp. H11T01]|uniref:SCO family protein n=1 Tax=Pseudomonas sp. H11T01 TaxID=3402749 RepID=UPI003AD0A836
MNRVTSRLLLTFCTLTLALSTSLAQAHSAEDPSEYANHGTPVVSPQGAEVKIVDVPLIDQHGRSVSLQRDLVSDRIVVMGFIYTHCTTVCPLVSSIMGKVQKQLGRRAGGEVQLVSISIDPQRDSPQRLLDYSRRFQDGPGWSWLTGAPGAIAATLEGLGSGDGDLKNHAPLILVGDGTSTYWTRFYGLTDPAVLLNEIDQLSQKRLHARPTAIAQESSHETF